MRPLACAPQHTTQRPRGAHWPAQLQRAHPAERPAKGPVARTAMLARPAGPGSTSGARGVLTSRHSQQLLAGSSGGAPQPPQQGRCRVAWGSATAAPPSRPGPAAPHRRRNPLSATADGSSGSPISTSQRVQGSDARMTEGLGPRQPQAQDGPSNHDPVQAFLNARPWAQNLQRILDGALQTVHGVDPGAQESHVGPIWAVCACIHAHTAAAPQAAHHASCGRCMRMMHACS